MLSECYTIMWHAPQYLRCFGWSCTSRYLEPSHRTTQVYDCVSFYCHFKNIAAQKLRDIQIQYSEEDVARVRKLETLREKNTLGKVFSWLLLFLHQRSCGGIVCVATPVVQENTAAAYDV